MPRNALPGRTSCIQLPTGRLTLQTEITTSPNQVVTVVDFGGRVVKTVRRPIADTEFANADEVARAFHNDTERTIRDALTNAGRSPSDQGTDPTLAREASQRTAAELFVMAANAFYAGDLQTANDLLVIVAGLLPADERVAAMVREVDAARS